MKPSRIIPLVLFGLIWSGFVIFFDSQLAGGLARQFVSRNFPGVTGRVTHSEVTAHRGNKRGVTYGADIRYRYAVNDQAFEGNRFRYNPVSTSNATWARDTVNAHPVGSEITVFYNPSQPSDALLSPGVDGGDLMILLLLTPFNLIMLSFWVPGASWLHRKLFKSTVCGVELIKAGACTRIRLPQFPAFASAFLAAGGLSFVLLLVVGISTGFRPSLPTAVTTLLCVFAGGAAAYFRQWRIIHAGDDDLVIDPTSGTVGLPETFGRKQRVSVAFSEVETVSVETITHYGKNGVSYSYAPVLRPRGQGFERLADWSDQTRAETFAAWLRGQLGLPPSG